MVIFKDNLEAERASLAIKDLRRKLKMSDLSEFKFNKSSKKFRQIFIESIKKFDFKIRAIAVDKKDIYSQRMNYPAAKQSGYLYCVIPVKTGIQSIDTF